MVATARFTTNLCHESSIFTIDTDGHRATINTTACTFTASADCCTGTVHTLFFADVRGSQWGVSLLCAFRSFSPRGRKQENYKITAAKQPPAPLLLCTHGTRKKGIIVSRSGGVHYLLRKRISPQTGKARENSPRTSQVIFSRKVDFYGGTGFIDKSQINLR